MKDISIVRGITAASTDLETTERDRMSSKRVPEVPLHATCWDGLKSMSISSLFPVQKICVYLMTQKLSNPQYSQFDCDLCVSAPTGSGKSLAYLLPIIHGLAERNQAVLRALVVLPTRDLAVQIASVASKFRNIKVQTITGQNSMADEREALMNNQCDIAVATMGRLVDHLVIGSLDLSYLRWLVVDEADRMLSKSDLDKWALVLGSVPDTTQRLLFSATMTSNPLKLNKLKLVRPLFVSVGESVSTINHKYAVVMNPSMKARSMLKVLEMLFAGENELTRTPVSRCLILCRSSANVESLTDLLSKFLSDAPVRPFSGNMTALTREKLLKQFSKGTVKCLVSTDVITRGIDIPDIDVVVNYDVPKHATTYIHRAGRTGRANKTGLVITLAEKKEMRHFRKEVIPGRKDVVRFNIDFQSLMKHYELEALVDNGNQEPSLE